jgi:hypothetical protein
MLHHLLCLVSVSLMTMGSKKSQPWKIVASDRPSDINQQRTNNSHSCSGVVYVFSLLTSNSQSTPLATQGRLVDGPCYPTQHLARPP